MNTVRGVAVEVEMAIVDTISNMTIQKAIAAVISVGSGSVLLLLVRGIEDDMAVRATKAKRIDTRSPNSLRPFSQLLDNLAYNLCQHISIFADNPDILTYHTSRLLMLKGMRGDNLSKLMLGGIHPIFNDKAVFMTAAMPAPPSRWPTFVFPDAIINGDSRRRALPNVADRAAASRAEKRISNSIIPERDRRIHTVPNNSSRAMSLAEGGIPHVKASSRISVADECFLGLGAGQVQTLSTPVLVAATSTNNGPGMIIVSNCGLHRFQDSDTQSFSATVSVSAVIKCIALPVRTQKV